MDFRNATALITGASSGLGEEFARQLAQRGANLVVVARSGDKLNELAEELRRETKVRVHVLPTDLADTDAVEGIIHNLKAEGIEVDHLVNNAGLGVFENFIGSPVDAAIQQIDVNVTAVVSLTHAFVSAMVKRNRGGVINVASNAAFQPLAGANVYAATKAFVLFFSEALSYELQATGITVTAACPGPVATRFFADMKPALKASQMDQPAPVVSEILKGYERRRRVVYPGKLGVRLSTWGARLMSRNLILKMAAKTVEQLNQR